MVRTARCKQDLSPENRFLRFFDLSEWNRILRSKTMRDVYEPKTETQSRLAFECREYSLGWIAVAVRHKAIKPQMKHSRFFSIGCRKNADSKYLWSILMKLMKYLSMSRHQVASTTTTNCSSSDVLKKKNRSRHLIAEKGIGP